MKLKDAEKFQACGAQAKMIFADYGAEPVTRGKAMGSIAGVLAYDRVAILKFPDMHKLEGAFASDACQAIIPLREEAADITIVKYEQLD